MTVRNLINQIGQIAIVTLFLSVSAWAQDVATVNGRGISKEMFAANLASNMAQGQKDTPEVQKAVLEELINRELLVQRAQQEGLTKTPDAQLAIKQIRENFEAGLAVNEYMSKHPITEAEVKADYDRQVSTLGGSGAQQVKISMIAVQTRIEAEDVIAQLRKRASFEKIAKERSIAASRAQGGAVGWVLPAQLPPEFRGAVDSLAKGAFTDKPIEQQGAWYVLKVDDKRPFKIPSYEESKQGIITALSQKRRVALIQELRSTAKITY